MNTIVVFYRKHFDAIFLCFGIIVTLSVLAARFLALPNNLVCSDEGWYLCLLRDTPRVGATRFHLLFHNVFKNDIYAIRLACWLSQLLGSLVLSLGVTLWIRHYCKDVKFHVMYLFTLCTLYFGQMGLVACPSFNYITMNTVIAEFGIGFMLIGMDRRKMVYFVLSGFMITFLFPTMITNVILIPIILLVILLLSDNKRKHGWGFVMGVILFFVYYFVFVESPKEVMQFLVVESKKSIGKGSADYGMNYYFLWLLAALLYFCKCGIVAAVLFALNNKLKSFAMLNRKRDRIMAMVVVAVSLLVYNWTYLEPVLVPFPYKQYGSIIWYRDLYWIFVFMLLLSVLKSIESVEKDKMLLCCLFLIVPLCLCFGSNVLFQNRQSAYFLFITPAIVFLTMNKNIVWKSIMMVILMGGFVLFLLSLFGKNFDGDRWFGGHVSVKTIGIQQNVKLSQDQLTKLVACENHVPKGRVLCSESEWWMVALLDYTPMSYDFRINKKNQEEIQHLVDEVIMEEGCVWVISNVWEDDFNEKMDMIQDYEKKVDTVGDNLYYCFSRELLK